MTQLKQWWNRTFYCSFWDCKPVDDGTWWHSRSGDIVLFEPKPCAKCGTMMGVPTDE